MKCTALALLAVCGLTVAAAAEELIVTNASGVIQTIDLETGDVGSLGACTGLVSAMAVADGVLYLGSGNFVWEFDLSTNNFNTFFTIPGQAQAMAWNGTQLLVANSDSTIITVDPDTQAVVETRNVPTSDISAIGIDAGGLFVGGQNSLALRAPIGSSSFQFFAACGSMINAMAFGPTTMYLAGTHFSDSQTGTIYSFDKFVGGVTYSGTFNTPNAPSAVLAHNGKLYVGGTDGMVHEMNPVTGDIFRSFDLQFAVTGIAPSDGLISCPADYDISGALDFFDVLAFLQLFSAHLPAGDTNGDGAFDFHDVVFFLDMFQGGCS